MYDPRVVETFFTIHGSHIDIPPAPAEAANQPHSALQTPLRKGDDRHDLDLQAFFDLGRAVAKPLSLSELGAVVWNQFRDRLPASTFVLYAYDRADDSVVAV